jgi:hypothetical protein
MFQIPTNDGMVIAVVSLCGPRWDRQASAEGEDDMKTTHWIAALGILAAAGGCGGDGPYLDLLLPDGFALDVADSGTDLAADTTPDTTPGPCDRALNPQCTPEACDDGDADTLEDRCQMNATGLCACIGTPRPTDPCDKELNPQCTPEACDRTVRLRRHPGRGSVQQGTEPRVRAQGLRRRERRHVRRQVPDPG